MMGATASRNPCTCSHSGLKLSLPSKRSSTVTTVPGCVCRKGTMLQPEMDYEAPSHHPRSAPTCLLCPARTRDLVPHPTLPTPAPAPKEGIGPEGRLSVPHSPSPATVDASSSPQPSACCQTSLMYSSRWRKLYELSKSPCTTMTGL